MTARPSTAKPFAIEIPDSALDDLSRRLENARFTDDAEAISAGWDNGTDITYMKELVDYWKNQYDWRQHEKEINQLSHYKATVAGTEIHFIHEKAKVENAPVLLLTHGWPDSFYRFHNVIPLLTEHFDVVVPSLPGFGFSERKAMNSIAVAQCWRELMTDVLGYSSFFASGGDLGSPVTKALAQHHGDVVKGVHLTDVGYPTGQEDQSTLSEAEQTFIQQSQWWVMTEGAYLFVHGNKPQSLAFGLNDSPVALAAWMISFANGGSDVAVAESMFGGRDNMLTNVMIHWLTQSGGSAIRMYREEAKMTYGGSWGAEPTPLPKSTVPAAVSVYPSGLPFPREWAERQGLNVQRFVSVSQGGHLAALEVPEIFAQDVRDALTELLA